MKKIISLLAALSMISTFGITNVFATDTITFSVSDPVEMSASDLEAYNEFLVDDMGEDELEIESGYKAYTVDLTASGIPATVSSNPARVMMWEVHLTFGSDMLQSTQPAYAFEDGDFGSSATSFEDATTLAVAFVTSSWKDMKAGTGDEDALATVVIVAKEGSSATVSKANLTVYVNKTKEEYGTATGALGKSVPAGTLQFGGSTPAPTPAIESNVDGVVTISNAQSDALKDIISEGKQIKVLTETFTGVTADTRFEITHNGETKTFGATLGQYFGISGSGTVDGSLGIAVVFPAGDNTNYTITRK